MFKLFLILCAAFMAYVSCAENADGVNWAVLVAGSNEYYNYRHQADICHAYQILHKNGIPDERIIVMMYDDIANNEENPTKGKIINKPGGPNVYPGVPKDYTKKAVTPKNFLHVLEGNKEALEGQGSGKVLESGPNDNVFIFFADHGAPDIIAFPDGSVLHSKALNKTLTDMYKNKKYKNMLIYVEACESGSMFENILAPNVNIYATTAANSEESSYACYYDDTYQTYLGDVYSVMWMEDSDAEDLKSETLLKQFQIVKKETNTSHVMQFGNLTMAKVFHVSDFQGSGKTEVTGERPNYEEILRDAVPTEEVRLSILRKKIAKETNPLNRLQLLIDLKELRKSYDMTKTLTKNLVSHLLSTRNDNGLSLKQLLHKRMKLRNHDCYMNTVDYMINGKCFSTSNEYFLKSLYLIVNLCEHDFTFDEIKNGVDHVCKNN